MEHLLLNFYFARQFWRRIAAWSCFDLRHYDVKMASGRARFTLGGWSEPAKSLRPTSESLMGLLLTLFGRFEKIGMREFLTMLMLVSRTLSLEFRSPS